MRFRVLILICCMLLVLTACGSGDGDVVADNVSLQGRINEEMIYYASELDLKWNTTMSDVDFKVYGSNVYYPEGQTVVTYSITDRKETVDTYKWADAPGEWFFEQVSYSEIGEVYGLVTVDTGATTSEVSSARYLCKFDTKRNLIFAKDLAEYYEDAGESYAAVNCRLEAGDDGRVFLSNTGVVWIFEADGRFKDRVSFGNVKDVWVRDFQSDARRNLYVLYEDNSNQNQYVAEIDTEKGSVTKVQQTIGLVGIGTTEETGQLLGFNGATVYTYYRENCSLIELFHWAECKVAGEKVYDAKQLADGRILVAGKSKGGSVENFLIKGTQAGTTVVGVNNAPGVDDAGKINLRLGVLVNASEELINTVYQFNKTNPKYKVIIEKYGETRAEGIALLRAEIEAGKAPDLLDVDFGHAESLMLDGYLEDLFLYLEESEVLSEGDFVNFALEEYNYDGMLAAIPHRFMLAVLMGNSEYVGEAPGWTLEEMVSFLEDNHIGDGSIYAEYFATRRNVFGDMFRTNEALFVDREAGTCNFDNDLFRRMVKVLASFPEDYDDSQVYAAYTNLQSGKSLLTGEKISEFTDLQPYDAALNGNLTCIGYPVEEGIGVGVNSLDAIGISALSDYKDGAWEFIETFLQYVKVEGSDFPTYVPALEKVATWNMEHSKKGYLMGLDGFKYEYHMSTPEEVEQCLELIEEARFIEVDTDLTGIINEEMTAYYAGEKSMDEMIENIETRVVQYLQENE